MLESPTANTAQAASLKKKKKKSAKKQSLTLFQKRTGTLEKHYRKQPKGNVPMKHTQHWTPHPQITGLLNLSMSVAGVRQL